ncbi:hypothetical protein ACC734_38455, partial [Rhizobium ruizarguesonis]
VLVSQFVGKTERGGDERERLIAIIRAGDKIVEQLKSEGRPFAKLTERKVVADHNSDNVDIVLAAEGGPIAPIGDVGVTGEKTVRPGF